LVLARLEIGYDLFRDFCKVSPLDEVVCLEKNGAETGFTDRVVLQVEFVKPVEGIRMSLWNSANN